MKHFYFLPFLATTVLGQTVVSEIDANNVSTVICSDGTKFWDGNSNQYKVPKTANFSTLFAGEHWYSATDDNENLYVAGQMYGQNGEDFQFGPISNERNGEYELMYNHVWKITRDEIIQHMLNFNAPDYEMPWMLEHWPGNGNVNNGEAALLAPFADYNNNLVYEPELGEHPMIKGDLALYVIYNDQKTHAETQGTPLNIEVHMMVYQYKEMQGFTDISNTTFVQTKIINRSNIIYQDFVAADFTDFDIGDYSDDFAGSAPDQNLIYGYNGDAYDNQTDYPIPSQGLLYLNRSLAGNVIFHTEETQLDVPTNYLEYYFFMHDKLRDGTPRKESGNAIDGENESPFMHHGEYGEDQLSIYAPGDRKVMSYIKQQSFEPGEVICIETAYVYGNGSDNLESLSNLKANADNVQNAFNILDNSCGVDSYPTSLVDVEQENAINLVNNIASNQLIFRNDSGIQYKYQIYDTNGKVIQEGTVVNDVFLNQFSSGIYIIYLNNQPFKFLVQ